MQGRKAKSDDEKTSSDSPTSSSLPSGEAVDIHIELPQDALFTE